jgi:hypothetical protein
MGNTNTMRKLWIATSAAALLCISALAVEQTTLHYGAWGFDATGEDRSVKAGDDFFRFANGGWLDRTPIPADKNIFGLRALMTGLTEARLHALMEVAASQAGAINHYLRRTFPLSLLFENCYSYEPSYSRCRRSVGTKLGTVD